MPEDSPPGRQRAPPTLTEVARQLAHDVNNPLAALCANLEVLAASGGWVAPSAAADPYAEVLGDCFQAVERIRLAVVKLRHLAEAEAGADDGRHAGGKRGA